jgi:hypothetical protein
MGASESKKQDGVIVAGTTSALTTGTGIVLMVLGGPIGVIAGGIVVGAGLSGTVSTA